MAIGNNFPNEFQASGNQQICTAWDGSYTQSGQRVSIADAA